MVSKASEDLPEPERPVITISLSRGKRTSIFLRLCSLAPRMTISRLGLELSVIVSKRPRGVGRRGAGDKILNGRGKRPVHLSTTCDRRKVSPLHICIAMEHNKNNDESVKLDMMQKE